MSTATHATLEKGADAVTRKPLVAGQPSWCPGCGNAGIMRAFFTAVEKLGIPQEKLCIVGGAGCASPFPGSVNAHGVQYLPGRALPFASGIGLSRPDLQVVLFADSDELFSQGGNYLEPVARRNVNLTCIITDHGWSGAIRNQAAFTQSREEWGNPVRKVLASGASLVARSHAAQVKHLVQMFQRALQHHGFRVVEVLSECVGFSPGVFDAARPKNGGRFERIEEKLQSGSDEQTVLRLCEEPWPGRFGIYFERKRSEEAQKKETVAPALDLLKARFEMLR